MLRIAQAKLVRNRKYLAISVAGVMTIGSGLFMTRSTIASLLGGAFGTTSSSTAIQLDKDLVGHWKLDGNTRDATPNANNGNLTTITSAVDRGGKATSAYDTTTNSFVVVPNSTTIQGKIYSYSFWINPVNAPTGAWRNILYKGTNVVATGRNPSLYLLPNDMYLHFMLSNGSTQFGITSSTIPLSLNQWSHVVLTSSGDSGTLNLYINGQLSDTYSHSETIVNNSDSFVFGEADIGFLDDIRRYNRVINPQEVSALYESYGAGLKVSEAQKGLIHGAF